MSERLRQYGAEVEATEAATVAETVAVAAAELGLEELALEGLGLEAELTERVQSGQHDRSWRETVHLAVRQQAGGPSRRSNWTTD